MRLQGPCQIRQHLRVLRAVIDVPDQAVFECDLPSCPVKIVPARLHQLRDRILIGDRHDLPALFIRDSVEGEGKRNGQVLFCQVVDPRNDPAGGHCDISLADIESVLIREKMKEAHQIVIVVKRLPGSHNDDVGDPLPGHSADLVDLLEHFRRRQGPVQAVQGGGAESASHSASHLGGNADAVSEFVAHEHAFHQRVVPHGEEIFLRPVQL